MHGLCQCPNIVFVFPQRQLEDYLNKLLRMAMYRKYHHTVSKYETLQRVTLKHSVIPLVFMPHFY